MNNMDCQKQGNEYWLLLEPKIEAECKRNHNVLPFIPVNDHYIDCMMPGGIAWWTNSFWPGLLWQAGYASDKDVYYDEAHALSQRLCELMEQPHALDHDIGFLMQLSAVTDFRLKKDMRSRKCAIEAANYLLIRYHKNGNYIQAWDHSPFAEDVSGWCIIDCMMNLSLLFWASEETNDQKYKNIAAAYADTAMHYLLRPDGSCSHIAAFNPDTGEFINNPGGQGYGINSSWSRGQGWALYGFALAFRHTGDDKYLEAAKRSAHYCISCMSIHEWLALSDFRAPAEPLIEDSGAAVIIACGLLELSLWVPEFEKNMYITAAVNIINACTKKYVDFSVDTDGILKDGSMMYHNDRLAHQDFIYGDYFYTEAVLRMMNKHLNIW